MKNWLKQNWFKLGILLLLSIAVFSVSHYYLISLPGNKQQETNIEAKEVKENTDFPKSYYATALQIGGVGSDLIIETVWSDDLFKYLDNDEFILTSFNSPRDIMWVNCKHGYYAASASSKSGNDPSPLFGNSTITNTGFGIEIKNQLQNHLIVLCEKINL